MDKIWQRLIHILSAQREKVAVDFYEGATEADFEELENLIQAKLPEEFKAFYRIHNGQVDKYTGLFYSDALLSIKDIILHSQHIMKFAAEVESKPKRFFGDHFDNLSTDELLHHNWQKAKEIQDTWWHQKWVRFTDNGCGDGYCVDLAPTKHGQMGQIIWYFHDGISYVESRSFEAWITDYAQKLEKGKYIYSQDYGCFVKDSAMD